MFVERAVWKESSLINELALAGETKIVRNNLWEFDIADSKGRKGVKGKSKGRGWEFEITRNSK